MKFKNVTKKMFTSFFIVAHALLLCNCEKEAASSMIISKIDSTAIESVIKAGSNRDSVTIIKPGVEQTFAGFNIADALPVNYVKDGSVDYTRYIQDAINKYPQIVFPGFPILINDSGLSIKAERTISFMPGSELLLMPSAKDSYAVLNIKNVSNVVVNNPVIRGERYKHIGTTGEWGHGISVNASSNVTINNAKVYDCWGDGIYVGGSTSSRNITINNSYCRSNRRNGISVTNVDGLVLNSPYTGYSDGTLPMSGIDIEPNNADNDIKNVRIVDPLSEFNKEFGIQISLSKFYGKNNKQLDIAITRHKDVQSTSAFKISCYNSKAVNNEIVKGSITVINPIWNKNIKNPLNATGLQEPNIKFILQNPTVYSSNGLLLNLESLKQLLSKGISKTTSLELKI